MYEGVGFENWGESVRNKPKYTFVPSTVLGLQNLVKFTKEKGLRVRCGGYRHSWSSIFSADNEILVSLLDLEEVNTIPDSLAIGPDAEPNGNELMSIDILEKPSFLKSGKNCVRVGAAVTNEAFRRWSIHHNVTALPMDVILVESVPWKSSPPPSGVNTYRTHVGSRLGASMHQSAMARDVITRQFQIKWWRSNTWTQMVSCKRSRIQHSSRRLRAALAFLASLPTSHLSLRP